MTNWAIVVPVIAASLGAVLGGLVIHFSTVRRDVAGLRRTQRIDYLISAYRRVVRASNREDGMSVEQAVALEDAIADIVLLGDAEEIEAARVFMIAIDKHSVGDLGPLIMALRSSLRAQVGLPDLLLPEPYNLRIDPKQSDKSTQVS